MCIEEDCDRIGKYTCDICNEGEFCSFDLYIHLEEVHKITFNKPPTIPVQRVVSLRDYFAIHAMSAIIIGNEADECVTDGSLGAAKDAYAVADAMIKVRDITK